MIAAAHMARTRQHSAFERCLRSGWDLESAILDFCEKVGTVTKGEMQKFQGDVMSGSVVDVCVIEETDDCGVQFSRAKVIVEGGGSSKKRGGRGQSKARGPGKGRGQGKGAGKGRDSQVLLRFSDAAGKIRDQEWEVSEIYPQMITEGSDLLPCISSMGGSALVEEMRALELKSTFLFEKSGVLDCAKLALGDEMLDEREDLERWSMEAWYTAFPDKRPARWKMTSPRGFFMDRERERERQLGGGGEQPQTPRDKRKRASVMETPGSAVSGVMSGRGMDRNRKKPRQNPVEYFTSAVEEAKEEFNAKKQV